ncbi:barstar family protein [Porphyrobacter sp. LM 6]|uniref:barstar family protein n=1 Tax=Porphyrobacter sp. LM 6 TaxID=1896196 RepID=UPI0008469C0B|nr:barstar family protein [Porphyrobacter sp. LM 6]
MSGTETFLVTLEGARIQTSADFFRELSMAVDIDLVQNLNALDDDLCDEIPARCGPYRIVWRSADKSNWSDPEITRILGCLFYQQQQYSDRFVELKLQFEEDFSDSTVFYTEIYTSPYYVAERARRSGKKADQA